jgi:polyvinyl alcohol dehydrogenase (cytochrome)
MFAVNAETGALLWKTHAEEHPEASITGTPKLDGGRLYVPVSGGEEEVAAGNPSFVCCKLRGSIVALDAKTGKQIWKSYTIAEPAKLTGKTSAGTEVWGPAGASVWSSPTIDPKHHALYFGTGVNYTQPLTNTSDAVLAFDESSGRMLWSQQLLPGDVYNFGCTTNTKLNCPENPGKNLDIGSPPILQSIGGEKRIMVVATKAGMVFGLDPDQQGKVLWKTTVSNGGGQGGVIWGGSSDGKNAYFSISDWNPGNPEAGGGVVALDIAKGKTVWSTPAPKPACLSVKGCSQAQPGSTSLIAGAVFAGSLDGHLRAYDTANGHIVWDFDTNRDFETIDGIKAHGGSINGTGASIAGGLVYANAGYSRFPIMAGNVFLVFSVDGK